MYYHYPLFIRLWHLLNAVFVLLLIISGLSMHYAGPGNPVIPFDSAVKMHNVSGVGLSLFYLIFFIGNIISGNGKFYRIGFKEPASGIILQIRYYLGGYFRKEKTPFPVTEKRKFNPLQAITYILVMYAGVPLVVLTGWFLLFPEMIPDRIFGISGIRFTDILHVATAFVIIIFLIIHIYVCTLNERPGSSFRAILTGWQKVEKD